MLTNLLKSLVDSFSCPVTCKRALTFRVNDSRLLERIYFTHKSAPLIIKSLSHCHFNVKVIMQIRSWYIYPNITSSSLSFSLHALVKYKLETGVFIPIMICARHSKRRNLPKFLTSQVDHNIVRCRIVEHLFVSDEGL